MPEEPMDRPELPLDELRRAWARAEPPRPDPELDACDERTRAAVAWMQAAWGRLEAPAPVVPLASRRSRWRSWAPPLAAAAGVLVALGAWLGLQRLGGGVRPGGVDTPITVQARDEGPAAGERPPALPDEGVEVAALAPDRVELRSGPVRLILLTGEDSPRNR